MIVGGYDLHLYCDTPRCNFKCQYAEIRKSLCAKNARKDGWKIRDGKAYCPNCKTPRKVKP